MSEPRQFVSIVTTNQSQSDEAGKHGLDEWNWLTLRQDIHEMLGRRDSDGRFGAEMKRLVDERNAVLYEYSRVMMERDVVHREIEQLQTDLSLSNAKWRALETENVQLAEENAQLKCKVEALNREITVVLEDHDTLLKELHDVRNTKRGELCGADADPTTSPALTVQETRMELEVLRKLLDKTRSQIEQAQLEVRGTLERCRHCTCDAVRTQCDDLRKERDRTVAELTQVLRNSNDIERQMNQILAELKELKDKLRVQNEASAIEQGRGCDSAIGSTDFNEQPDTETVEIELELPIGVDSDLVLAVGTDGGYYVVAVTDEGSADGRIRINDRLIQVASLSCASADLETVRHALLESKTPFTVTVRRRRAKPSDPTLNSSGLVPVVSCDTFLAPASVKCGSLQNFLDDLKSPAPVRARQMSPFVSDRTVDYRFHSVRNRSLQRERIKRLFNTFQPPRPRRQLSVLRKSFPTSTQDDRFRGSHSIRLAEEADKAVLSMADVGKAVGGPPKPLPPERTDFPKTTKIRLPSSSTAAYSSRPAFHVETIRIEDTEAPEELHRIRLGGLSEPLGIQIISGVDGGVFVSSVHASSVAEQTGLQVGDQLLEVCGINMRCATYEQAALVLHHSKFDDSMTLLVQHNPTRFQELQRVACPSTEPADGDATDRFPILNWLMNNSVHLPVDRPQSPAPTAEEVTAEPRDVHIDLSDGGNLGDIGLIGGNRVGIFIHSVRVDSSACRAGLRSGDRVLEFNGVDLRQATAETAAHQLGRTLENVTLKVQFDLERYRSVAEQPGDGFYVRAEFDWQDSDPKSLSFSRQDILYIDNTMLNGVPGQWRAWLVDDRGKRVRSGAIPSEAQVSKDLIQRSPSAEYGSRSSFNSAMRSFLRWKTRVSGRSDSHRFAKETTVPPQGSRSSIVLSKTEKNRPALRFYTALERLDPTKRPVIIVGPLCDLIVDVLARESVMRPVENAKLGKSNRRPVLDRLASVQSLDPSFVGCDEFLHQHHARHPIVLLIKFKSARHLRAMRNSLRPANEDVPSAEEKEEAKKSLQQWLQVEMQCQQLISAVIPAGDHWSEIGSKVVLAVEEERAKITWIPRDML